MEYGDFNLDEEQTKELNKNLDELSEKIDKYEREYDDRKVITDDLLTGLNTIEENLKNLINKADKIKVDVPKEEPKKDKPIGIIKTLTKQTIKTNIYENEFIKSWCFLKDGKHVVFGTRDGFLYLYEVKLDAFKECGFVKTCNTGESCEITCITEIFNGGTYKSKTRIVVSSWLPRVYIYEVTTATTDQKKVFNLIDDFYKGGNPLNSVIHLNQNIYVYSINNGTFAINGKKPDTTYEDRADPVALLKISDSTFCISWKWRTADEPTLKFYDSSGKELNYFKDSSLTIGCHVYNGIFFVPKSEKRKVKNELLVVGYDNEKEGKNQKVEIRFLDLIKKEKLHIIQNSTVRFTNSISFALFGEKYICCANQNVLIQIDIDDGKIVKTFKNADGFAGQFLAFLPDNNYIITDNEVKIVKERNKTRHGLTLFKIDY